MLAGYDGGGDLSAGESADGGVFRFGATRGVGGERDDRVGGVEANADEVNLRGFCHLLNVNEIGSGLWVLADHLWQRFGGGAEDNFVEGFGVEGLFWAHVDGAHAALVGDVDEAGGGIDGAGGADDQEDGGAVEFAVDGIHVEGDFTEPNDVGPDGGSADLAGGKIVRVFVEGLVGERLVATTTAGFEEATVHVMDAV